jgi:D-alanyl-D-alanine carboxypeptidase/D-alanyl-D-alanine-endopeptidase (penicillin-binding protein 4)
LCAFVAVALVLAAPQPAVGAVPLQERLANALAVPNVQARQTGAVAVDLRTGEKVFSLNAQRSFLPASTEKLAVAYAALHALGADFRIETDVLGEGFMDGSTWHGSLVLKGFGDPTLSRADLRALARGVRAFGVRAVTGGVVGDESYFDTRRVVSGWKPSYFIDESPPLSALIVDRARIGGTTSRNPPLQAAALFRAELVAAGVAVTGRARAGRTDAADFPLAFVHSPSLAELVRFMGVESDNFVAEMLLKALGAAELGKGTTAAGAKVVRRELAERDVPLVNVRIVDGSGLSRLDRLTARALASLLLSARADARIAKPFVASLAVAGVNGTLEDRLEAKPARGTIRAKTGTTDLSSALAGYAGDGYVFAVVMNGSPVAPTAARAAQDRFATILARAL